MELGVKLNKNTWAICFAEFFSSFSYFGVLSLLLLFLLQNLQLPQKESYNIVGNFSGVSFISALAGGLIGSRYLSERLCCLLGFIGYTAGYFILINYQASTFLYLGLALIAGGFGLFEPNIQILFGTHFSDASNTKRNFAFIVFYLFNIVGQFLGAVTFVYVNTINLKYVFIAAGIISLVGLVFVIARYQEMMAIETKKIMKSNLFFETSVLILIFVITLYMLIQSNFSALTDSWMMWLLLLAIIAVVFTTSGLLGFNDDEEALPETQAARGNTPVGIFGAFLLFSLSFFTMLQSNVKSLFIMLFFPITIFLIATLAKADKETRKRILSLFLLFFAGLVAVLCLRVCFGLIDLFTKNFVDNVLWGWHIQASLFDASEKLLILLVVVAVIGFIKYFAQRNAPLTSGVLMSFGLLMLALCFGFLAFGITLASSAKISPAWLFLAYLFMAIGELCTIPIVISAIIGLAPREWRGGMMGLKFMVIGIGAYFSDEIGKLITPITGNPTLVTYQHLFLNWMLYTALFTLVFYFVWKSWGYKI
ncbi:MAG: hypothetical protein A3F12_00020 [Gammaproteobacteria bacterium RIFCSPHIGHO2_12_FULL_38_14]|nr:MAG: hypothetical protein A3F12_00020 [Gammaproteobacteria bacterium RIFCSPHIGHO2_12_FULL_38_14]